ncbi:MAG: O-antigen ligase family protein [Pseudomonadota bacterium]
MALALFRSSPTDRSLKLSRAQFDMVIVTLWFTVTFKQFRFDELILYPLALYFAYAFVRDYRQVEPMLRRSLVLFIFPLWFLIGMIWALDPALVAKAGLQMILTMLICFYIAINLEPRRIVLAILIAASVFGVLSFLEGLGGGSSARGVFASKNAMGAAMLVMWLAALGVLLDPWFDWRLRVCSLAAAALASYQVLLSNSATALILMIALAGLFGMGVIFLRGGPLFRLGSLSALCLMLFLFFGGLSIIAAAMSVDPIGAVLDAFGKDRTLTGRTLLWQYADREISENPLLGIGHGSFWVAYDDSPMVRRIFAEFHKSRYTGSFSFHNSYYEIAVHQGLIGLGIALMPLLWALYLILSWVIGKGGIASVFFLGVASIVIARTFTESFLIAPFAQLPMLYWTGALLVVKQRLTEAEKPVSRPESRINFAPQHRSELRSPYLSGDPR